LGDVRSQNFRGMISKNGESSEVHPPHRMMMIFFQLLSNRFCERKTIVETQIGNFIQE